MGNADGRDNRLFFNRHVAILGDPTSEKIEIGFALLIQKILKWLRFFFE